MIVVKLMGGLGNQMFQYSLGRHLALRRKTALKLDLHDLDPRLHQAPRHVRRVYDLDIFNVDAGFATQDEVFRLIKRSANDLVDKSLNKVVGLKKQYIREPHFHFWDGVFRLPDDVYLEGYWQSERYFADVHTTIRDDFTFREAMGQKAQDLLDEIASSNSICVNVRRGDFVTNSFHGAQSIEYYRRAEFLIREKVGDEPQFFVFSDEIEWCEANLQFGTRTRFVSHEYAGRKFQDYLRLMVACKHFIIPNSSFGWWAVWLNTSGDKIVIAPSAWFGDASVDTSDLIPASWIRI